MDGAAGAAGDSAAVLIRRRCCSAVAAAVGADAGPGPVPARCRRRLLACGGRSRRGLRLRQGDLGAVLELVGAVNHDHFAGLQSLRDSDVVGIARAEHHLAHVHRVVLVDDVHVGARCAALHGRLRNKNGVMERVQEQHHVHELLRKQVLVGVGKARLELDRAGRGIDLAVDRRECAGRQLGSVGAVERGGAECLAGLQLLQERRDRVFGEREHDRDGLQLRDHDQSVGLGRGHVIAHVDLLQTDPAADGRGDVAIDKVELGGVDGRLVGLDVALVLHDERLLCCQLLFGDGVLTPERLVALQVDARVVEQRLVTLERSLGLFKRHLIGSRVDEDQRIAGLDHLPFLEGDVHDLAADLTLHGDGRERRHRAESQQRDGHVAAVSGCTYDRHGSAGGKAPARGLGATLGRQCPGEQRQREQYRHDDGHVAGSEVSAPAGSGVLIQQLTGVQIAVFVIHGGRASVADRVLM